MASRRRELTMPQRLRRGLVAYWPLANNTAVDVKSALYDGAGPYDLTNNNIVTQAAGPSNNLPGAANFVAASSQYFEIADNKSLSITGNLTIAAWVYFGTLGAELGLVSKFVVTGNQRSYHLEYDDAGGVGTERLRFFVSADGTATTSRTAATFGALATGTWYFVVVRHYNGSQISITVNAGVEDTTAHTGGIFDSTAALRIGAGSFGAPHNGRISHVGIWSRIVSRSEEFWLYNNGAGRDLTRGV